MTYPYGVHLAQVEVDPATGGVRVLRYFIAYEVGRAVNPALVEGQLVGGAAQGLGGALLEEFRYDASGQPQCTSFMDYLIPSAAEVPPVGTAIREDAPSPGNPLGVEGRGRGRRRRGGRGGGGRGRGRAGGHPRARRRADRARAGPRRGGGGTAGRVLAAPS